MKRFNRSELAVPQLPAALKRVKTAHLSGRQPSLFFFLRQVRLLTDFLFLLHHLVVNWPKILAKLFSTHVLVQAAHCRFVLLLILWVFTHRRTPTRLPKAMRSTEIADAIPPFLLLLTVDHTSQFFIRITLQRVFGNKIPDLMCVSRDPPVAHHAFHGNHTANGNKQISKCFGPLLLRGKIPLCFVLHLRGSYIYYFWLAFVL